MKNPPKQGKLKRILGTVLCLAGGLTNYISPNQVQATPEIDYQAQTQSLQNRVENSESLTPEQREDMLEVINATNYQNLTRLEQAFLNLKPGQRRNRLNHFLNGERDELKNHGIFDLNNLTNEDYLSLHRFSMYSVGASSSVNLPGYEAELDKFLALPSQERFKLINECDGILDISGMFHRIKCPFNEGKLTDYDNQIGFAVIQALNDLPPWAFRGLMGDN